ncbi:MAG: hypothetical protein HN919_08345 [Verrucomicrobia bacterium]|jgi:hypothetical protein|nr:hypothetical protein [Verrucomicrobiota bacterium]MBT7066295.1 hypothetical protein [Verrucomicrobiota bacterium]MBT7699661.1 hypothetical protein [Verrucomicrobiota bacterium]
MADDKKITDTDPADTVDNAAETTSQSDPLRVKPREDDAGDALFGASETVDDDQIGAPVKPAGKKGLAALFGGAKAVDDGESLDEPPTWAVAGPARPRPQGSGIRVVNRFVAAAIVLILVFGVLDLFATIRQPPGDMTPIDTPTDPAAGVTAATQPPSEGLPLLAKLLDSFGKRPIVRDLDQSGSTTTDTEVVTTRTRIPDWKVYAQHLDLIGLSGGAGGEKEAIVADRKANRMHFLRIGQEMVAGEIQFKLVRIATDHVVFEKDGEEVIVK